MDKRILALVLVLAACNGSGSGTSSGTSSSSSGSASSPSGDSGSGGNGSTTTSGPPATPSSTSPGASPSDAGSGSNGGGGGVTITNVNNNTNTSGSSSSSGSSSNSGSSAQAGAASGASASASSSSSSPPPAQLSVVTAAEGPEQDVDEVTVDVSAIELFWSGYDDRLIRDGMSCRMPGASFTLVTATGTVQENPSLFAFADVKTITYDFTKSDTTPIQACSTDHLGTPQMLWVVGRVKVHHVGAAHWRDAHGQITCRTDDGQQLAVLRMTPPVDLRGGHLSTAGFHLRSADITEKTVSCASGTQPQPPECATPIESFEPTGSRITYWISSGFASTATEQ